MLSLQKRSALRLKKFTRFASALAWQFCCWQSTALRKTKGRLSPAFLLLNSPFADGRIAAHRRNFLHQFGDEPLKHALIDLHALPNDRALAEHGFAGFVGGLLALIEEADRNAVAPFMRTLSGHGNICRIVSLFVLEPVTALLEILVGIHLVIGDARAEGVNQREALVLNARGDQIRHVIGLA